MCFFLFNFVSCNINVCLHSPDGGIYYLLLQLCSGVDETAPGAGAQLVFAPINESFTDDTPLLPSGFRVIPLDGKAVSISVLYESFLERHLVSCPCYSLYAVIAGTSIHHMHPRSCICP